MKIFCVGVVLYVYYVYNLHQGDMKNFVGQVLTSLLHFGVWTYMYVWVWFNYDLCHLRFHENG